MIINKTVTTALVFVAGVLSLQAKPARSDSPNANVPQGSSKTDIESALFNLNLHQQQPDLVNELYRAAWDILSANQGATYSDLMQDEAFQALCAANGMDALGGPMLGNVTAEGAKVWIRTLQPAKVEVQVKVGNQTKVYGPVQSTAASDLTAIVTVDGLKPDTSYPYSVLVDGKPISIPKHAAITTAPKEGSKSPVRITFGSCLHRWGFGNQMQSDMIRSRKPTAMLLLGDIAAQDRENHLGLHRVDYLARDLHPAWQDLSATVPMYATWDDHDYFDNDKAGVYRDFTVKDKEAVCDVFQQSWNNPSYGFNDERRGVFLRTRIGPADVIMVDNRYFRENKKGSFLGDEQMQWLEAQLLDCKGPFIILSCGSMWSDYVSAGKDSWGKFDPEGRERIFQLIERNKIPGVILISGDRHGARGFTIPRPSGFEFYEFEAASLGGRCGPPTQHPSWKTQLYGICDQYAFGELSIDADLEDPEVTFRLVEDLGTVIYEKTLTRSQLTP
ncbi:MAG: alkaline phosphatase family protein [Opitutales bacterium]|nr:alkaline phosphatase family protein [Opitutales bacterium]